MDRALRVGNALEAEIGRSLTGDPAAQGGEALVARTIGRPSAALQNAAPCS
jgi:hypothetical protein